MKCFDPLYNTMPKVELHCHLEGSIRTTTLYEIARESGLPLPAENVDQLEPFVRVYEQLDDLQSVLNAFALAQNSFTSQAAVERVAYELFEDAARQNIHLFEVRFSPDWAFSRHQLNWDAALEGILRARERAQAQWGMAIGLIAITSRSRGVESCKRTVDWAIRHRDVLCGFDLADGEREHPIGEFSREVLRVRDAGLKITVHSGEDTPASYVVDTIRAVNPERIGHGIHIIEDDAAIEMVKEHGITLEVNPWSNYLTHSVRRIEDHPLKRLFDRGVKVTINSDDPELLNTNLNNEYRLAHEVLGMSLEEIATCNRYALEASFLPDEMKRAVMEQWFS